MKTLVLGCGNILAGDDGVGVRAAEALEKLNLPRGVCVADGGTPGHGLAELLIDYDRVLILDALVGRPPGRVDVFDREDLPGLKEQSWHLHGPGLRESLMEAQKYLAGRFPRVKIIAVRISPPAEWSEKLSPPVEAAVEKVVGLVMEELNS